MTAPHQHPTSSHATTTRLRVRASLGALVIFAAVLLGGCPQTTTVNTNTEATSAPVPTIDKTKDEKTAKAALIGDEQLPGTGWNAAQTATTAKQSSGSSFDCPELGPTFNEDGEVPNQAKASSPAFERERPFGRVSNEVIFFADENTAKAEVDSIKAKSDQVRKCFERGFSHDFAREGRSGETTVDNWNIGKMGSGRVGFEITVTFKEGSGDVEVHLGMAIVRVGRAATVVVIGQLDPLDDQAKDIAQAATDKLTDAQG